jgi:acyl carrier protein
MNDKEARLAGCFQAVFPGLSADEVNVATASSVANWDSVAVVTLLAVVEEEFGITIDSDDLAAFSSYDGFLRYLNEIEQDESRSRDSFVS